MKNKLLRILALACCFVMMATIVPVVESVDNLVYADLTDDLKDLNAKYDALEKEQKQLQSKIDGAKSDKEKQLAIKNETAQEITILESQISVLEDKILLLERDIAAKEEEIVGLSDDIAESYQLFKDRMKAIYMSDTSTTIGLVLGADSYGDYLARSENVKRVADHDRQLIADLNESLANVEQKKAALDEDKADLDAAKLSVEAKNRELDGRLATTVSKIQDLADMEKQFLANKTELQKQMKEMQEEIDEVYSKIESIGGDYVGGDFMYPVPTCLKITSYYGSRFGGANYHTGIDFSNTGILGKNVVAANSGVVTLVQNSYTPFKGYGRYMIVDHGGGYTTLYGHLSEITVSQGDSVGRGKPIAKVGNTGWSTGPHLHFEIRLNKIHQNPMNYL